MSETYQTSFTTPEERVHQTLSSLKAQADPDKIVLAVSGGTDSIVAADVFSRFGPEYGFVPDEILHINTGASIPQSRLVAKTIADVYGIPYREETYRNPQDSLAERILNHGWPGGYAGAPWTGGHGLEWANRKGKPMDKRYAELDGQQVWVSGARINESSRRQGNVPATGVQQDKPRRTWGSPIAGWSTHEKREYIREYGLPVSEAYLLLGFSGECVACAFDEIGLLTDIDILCPELSHTIRTLTTWLYQRILRGDVDLDPKRLCWGWQPDGDTHIEREEPNAAQAMVGCDEDSCATRENASWVLDLPEWQIVDRQDVERYWQTGKLPTSRILSGVGA